MSGFVFPACTAVLFADQHAIRNVMRGMHNRQEGFDSSGLTTLLVFCLFFVTVWGVARMFGSGDGRSSTNSTRALFNELCRAHRVSLRDWWLLMRLARHHRLTDPTLLFLESTWLDPARCPAAWQRHASRLRELRGTLFAGLASPRCVA
ncbi:MAG: hypothetical protein ACREHD_01135 [Pirellulales bacterium]